jgi:ubiquitin C-terminal hydrolase
LNEFIRPEIIEGENAWFNEKTGKKEDIQKKTRFWSFPKILIITLKRFSLDGSSKISQSVEYPVNNLDLTPYVCGYGAEKYKYNLYGVCCHYGTIQGGHYTSIVKDFFVKDFFVKDFSVDDVSWFHYNDHLIQHITENEIVNPNAYCLFYEQCP